MRVFVAGATGVLGRRIVRQLVARGHVAVGLTRSESGDATVRSLGGEPRRADLFDVDAPPVGDPILASALDSERIAREAGAKHGFRTAILRCGGFYSADGWHTRILAESLFRGRPVLVDGGTGVWSWLHAEDAASAFVAASEWPKPGLWHVVDDRPASLREFLGLLAEKLGTRPPRRVSRSVARLFVGRYAADLLAASFPTSNERFRSDFRWTASFPTFEKGLGEVVAAWRS